MGGGSIILHLIDGPSVIYLSLRRGTLLHDLGVLICMTDFV